MKTSLLITSAASCLLLVGCPSITERQERAYKIFDSATDQFVEGVEQAKQMKAGLSENLSSATDTFNEVKGKLEDSAAELQDRAQQVQQGIEKVSDAVQQGAAAVDTVKDGVADVQDGLSISGEEEAPSEEPTEEQEAEE
jgi:methyl-accepting chemotaxis protein